MLLDFKHIIPTIEHSRRDKIITKVRKSVIARYLKVWVRERCISEMGLEYSGRMFFDSVLFNIVNQCLVLLICQNHRVHSAEKLCEKPGLGCREGLGMKFLLYKHEAWISDSQKPQKNQGPVTPVYNLGTERWREECPELTASQTSQISELQVH